MARLATADGTSPEITAINLTRLLDRLQQTLLKPDASTEHRLRTSIYERSKVGTNLDYAKNLLLRQEQDAANIKVLSKKHEVQTDLLRKRDAIERLAERLEQLNHSASDPTEDSSEGEDLLGEDTPSEDDSEHIRTSIPASSHPAPQVLQPPTEASSTIRSRNKQSVPASQDRGQTTSTDTTPLALSEKMLSHNRAEQENLTESLLSMARALNSSQKAFQDSLDADTKALDRAVDGLDKNTSGLEAAQKRMGLLSRMSEGKGWWGRMMLYAWIFGLMFTAFAIVAFMPKLRF